MLLTNAFQEANNEAEILLTRKIYSDIRSKTAAAYFAIVQQHQYSIFLLLTNSPPLHASAFSLLRPLTEAVIKGLWIKLAATDSQIQKTISGENVKNTHEMVRLIASKYNSSKTEINNDNWKALSSYTHSGHLQLQNWIHTKNVEPNYSAEAISDLIKLTRLSSKLAYNAVFTISSE